MSLISGYETDVVLKDEDKQLRVLVMDGVSIWYLDGEEVFSTYWKNCLEMFQGLIDEIENS